jgi:hemerythrin
MNYATFDDTLITGNEMIDNQHKELIEKINGLLKACEEGNAKIKAIQMLDYLSEYTDFHFGAEEKLQEEIGYPGLALHQEKHKEFVQTIAELHEMLAEVEGPTDEFVAQVERNVIDWLYNHIKTFDRSVAEYRYIREN